MPLMMPRATATVVDANAFRFLTRYDVPLESLSAQDEATLNALLASQLPPSVEAALDEARRAIDAGMTAVAGELPRVDPTLEGAARSTLSCMQDELTKLQAKVIQAAKRRNVTGHFLDPGRSDRVHWVGWIAKRAEHPVVEGLSFMFKNGIGRFDKSPQRGSTDREQN